MLAPRLLRSTSPESSANLLLDFSHLTDQMNFSNLIDRANGAQNTHTSGPQQPEFAFNTSNSIGAPPPAPPPLPMYNLQPTPMQESAPPTAGPSNFNAAFDCDSTYGVASSNYDTPFLSASEADWLFNHASMQFDAPLPNAGSPSSNLPASMSASASTLLPPSTLPLSMYQQNPHLLPNGAAHFHEELSSPRQPNQFPQMTARQNGNSSNAFPRNDSFSLTSTSASLPSSLSTILNPAQQRRSRHVHFADGQAVQQTQSRDQQAPETEFHPPLAPPSNTFHNHHNQTFAGDVGQGQSFAPRPIKISLATRNRLANHLAVRRYSLPGL